MDAFVEVLRDFPYYERHNKPGEVIPLPIEDARFWHEQGFVRLETRTLRVGARTIRQEVWFDQVRYVAVNNA